MRKYNLLIIIIIAIFSILISIFYTKLDKLHFERIKHSYLNYYYSESLNGVILKKYIDKRNHSIKTIQIRTIDDTISLAFDFDNSGLFEYLIKGDSISKNQNSFQITVLREKENPRTFYLN